MKYCLVTPILEAQIAEIRRKIMLSMNGIVSEKMTQSGIVYKKNYGVDIPRLKEIAASYSKNSDLAQRLWLTKIRETMIIASLLYPKDKFTKQSANEWVSEFHHVELVEQVSMNLFQKLPFANELCLNWIYSNHSWTAITGYVLSARVYDKFSLQDTYSVINKAFESSDTADLHLYKAIALCLSRMCRISKEICNFISTQLDVISETNSSSQRYISSEVKQEIFFLDNL